MTALSSAPAQHQEVCSLRVAGTLFAVPLRRILEILGKPAIQPVPLASDFISGLVHYRGEALVVLSLRHLLGMEAATALGDVLVFESPQGAFGLLVDSVGEVLRVSAADHEPNPPTLDSRCQTFFAGAWKQSDRLLVALDPDQFDPLRLACTFANS
jgi:purine-binding chemotaxis protein CheW